MKDIRIGLKLWSTNVALIDDARKLFNQNLCQYIELYVVPGSFEDTIERWRNIDVPVLLHAPHDGNGVNLANSSLRESNRKAYGEVLRFADHLASPIVIVHPGNRGTMEEIALQLCDMMDARFYLENKPRLGLANQICHGSSPAEMRWLLDATGLKDIVLDFGHAVYAARSMGVDGEVTIRGFLQFGPKVFHLADGLSDSEQDVHLNFGDGDFDVNTMLSFVPPGSFVTLETPRRSELGLSDFVDDVEYVKNILLRSAGDA